MTEEQKDYDNSHDEDEDLREQDYHRRYREHQQEERRPY